MEWSYVSTRKDLSGMLFNDDMEPYSHMEGQKGKKIMTRKYSKWLKNVKGMLIHPLYFVLT